MENLEKWKSRIVYGFVRKHNANANYNTHVIPAGGGKMLALSSGEV